MITTFVDEVGTPPHQLPSSVQSLLNQPDHVPDVQPVLAFKRPVVVEPKYVAFLFVAVEMLLPHEPVALLIPPKVKFKLLEVDPLGSKATAVPLIERLLKIVVEPANVLFPVLLKARLP